LQLKRDDFYEKELTFQVSCSYGPGRYDPAYEDKGHDYPVGFVRWTEQRNFEAVLDMLAERRINVTPLISHRFSIEEAAKAYNLLGEAKPSIGILLEYQKRDTKPDLALLRRTVKFANRAPRHDGEITVSFIGAGNYSDRTLVPAFRAAGGRLGSVASNGG